jgi:uncharacterized protein (TIGR02594 family)
MSGPVDAYNKELPKWMLIALAELGVTEEPGEKNNPRVLEYHGATSLKSTADDIPWCSAFLCWVMECARVASTRSAAARSWADWGNAIQRPKFGAIAVLERGKHAWQGHVGLYLDSDATKVYVLGGNQGDRVSVQSFLKTQVISYRWPIEDQNLTT